MRKRGKWGLPFLHIKCILDEGSATMKNTHIVITLIALAMVMGCATRLGPGEKATEPDRTSGPNEKWVTDDKDYKETKDKIFFRVQAQGQDRDYVDRVSLPAAAIGKVAQRISTIATRELGEALVGSKSTLAGQVGKVAVNAISKAQFSGLTREKFYWERYRWNRDGSMVYEYEGYGWYFISVDEYKEAKRRAWDKAAGGLSSADRDADAFLEETGDRFIQGLNR